MQKILRQILCTLHKYVDKIVWLNGTASPFYGAPRAFFSEETQKWSLRLQRKKAALCHRSHSLFLFLRGRKAICKVVSHYTACGRAPH